MKEDFNFFSGGYMSKKRQLNLRMMFCKGIFIVFLILFALGGSILAILSTSGPTNTIQGTPLQITNAYTKDWNVTWGTSFDEWFNQVIIGTDGLYLCGISQKSSEDDTDAIIVKFDFDGIQLWNETWDLASVDKSADIAFASDGIYFSGSFGQEWLSDSDNVFLTKYSHSGVQIWNTTWGGVQDDQAHGLCYANQSIFVTGSTLSYSSSTSKELFLLEYDSSGNQEVNVNALSSPERK